MYYAIKRDSDNRFFLQTEEDECVHDRDFPTRTAAEAFRSQLLKREENTKHN